MVGRYESKTEGQGGNLIVVVVVVMVGENGRASPMPLERPAGREYGAAGVE